MSDASGVEPSPAEDRLESWKEIAAYMRRDVRTVQRWEQVNGLPIHRHPRAHRAIPYAYKSELDAWWRGSSLRTDQGLTPHSPRYARGWIVYGAMIGLAAVAVGVTDKWSQRHALPVTLTREPALIARFANHTGDSAFDLTLETALARELSTSAAASIVPTQRVQDALRLMRRPQDVPLDKATAIEVCRRDGGILILLAGSIDRIDSTYALNVEIVRAIPDETIATVVAHASAREDVLPAMRTLARRVRELLGEQRAIIEHDKAALEKVTTPSLEALRLYSQADTAMARGQERTAIELLRRAIDLDPDFPSAHILLAWAIHNTGGDSNEWRVHARRAFELSDRSTDGERYFIRGSYYELDGQLDEALASYGALLQFQPEHYWALGNLVDIYESLGADEAAAQYVIRVAERRPYDLASQAKAGWELAILRRDKVRATPFIERARQLVAADENVWVPSPATEDVNGARSAAFITLYPAFEAWATGHVNEASRLVDEFASRTACRVDNCFRFLGQWFWALGRLREADDWFSRETSPARDGDLMNLALGREDDVTLRSLIPGYIARHGKGGGGAAVLFADELAVRREVEYMSAPAVAPVYRETAEGVDAVLTNDSERGITLLEQAWRQGRFALESTSLVALEKLAAAYAAAGHPDRAVDALERATAERDRTYCWWVSGPSTMYFWMRTQDLLARLYRAQHRVADARHVEDLLLSLLAAADRDHPMLKRIEGRRSTDAPTVK